MNIVVTMPIGVTRDTFIPSDVKKQIEAMGTVTWNTLERNYEPDELREAIKFADVCITGWGCRQFDEYVLDGNERLKLIVHTGGSVATLVCKYTYDKGIKVLSGNKLYAESVAEGVIGYILTALRDITTYSNDVQAGNWPNAYAYNEGLLDQSVGLVGFGAVARYLVPMLKVFRTKIKVYDPFISDELCKDFGVERVSSLEDVFTSSKIISLHAPGIPGTKHMISSKLLSMVPDGALLVNTARGGLIDEAALADELQKGRFKAVLDVYEVEPLPKDSELRGLSNAILIPHMAGPTVDRRKMVTATLLEDIQRYFEGQPLQHEIKVEYGLSMTRDN